MSCHQTNLEEKKEKKFSQISRATKLFYLFTLLFCLEPRMGVSSVLALRLNRSFHYIEPWFLHLQKVQGCLLWAAVSGMEAPASASSFPAAGGFLPLAVSAAQLPCGLRWSLFVPGLSAWTTLSCLILEIFISLNSWEWINLISWSPFLHSRLQNR